MNLRRSLGSAWSIVSLERGKRRIPSEHILPNILSSIPSQAEVAGVREVSVDATCGQQHTTRGSQASDNRNAREQAKECYVDLG